MKAMAATNLSFIYFLEGQREEIQIEEDIYLHVSIRQIPVRFTGFLQFRDILHLEYELDGCMNRHAYRHMHECFGKQPVVLVFQHQFCLFSTIELIYYNHVGNTMTLNLTLFAALFHSLYLLSFPPPLSLSLSRYFLSLFFSLSLFFLLR